MKKRVKIIAVAGARPNFMKISPVLEALESFNGFETLLVHTGQHYDHAMSRAFFDDLGLRRPDINLDIGSDSQVRQVGRIMIGFEEVLDHYGAEIVIVVGDVNSTLACALAAKKMFIPVAHIEAGLRSFDPMMPEEINRYLTDQMSRWLFTTCRDADDNLGSEGLPEERIHFVGNVMIDTLNKHLDPASKRAVSTEFGLAGKDYMLVTMHRPKNVDDKKNLLQLMHAFEKISERAAVIFPIHPRTRESLREFDFAEKKSKVKIINPLGYLDFLSLMKDARLVLTDSGGIQEETTVLGIPCLTLRENTERPITISKGTNKLVGTEPQIIIDESFRILNGAEVKGSIPEKWDGKASERIAAILAKDLL